MPALTWNTVEPPGDDPGSVSSRPGLVILHGVFGAGRNWSLIARRLAADGWRVTLPDLRNHGRSPWTESMTYPEQAADVAGVLDAVSPDAPAVLIGHSMGGKTALRLALERPDRVAALALVDVAPVDYGSGRNLDVYARAMMDLPLEDLTRRADADRRLSAVVSDAGLRAFLLQNLILPGAGAKGDAARPRWRLNLPVISASLPALADWPPPPPESRFEGPVLALAGGESDYVGPAGEVALGEVCPNVRVESIPGAGHWVHAEAPDDTVAALRGFLDRAASAFA